MDFNFECINLLQTDLCKQRYIPLKCNYLWPRQNLPENSSVQNFFAEYILHSTGQAGLLLAFFTMSMGLVTGVKQIHTWALIIHRTTSLCIWCVTECIVKSLTVSTTTCGGGVITTPSPGLKRISHATGNGTVPADPRVPCGPPTIGKCDIGVCSILISVPSDDTLSRLNIK